MAYGIIKKSVVHLELAMANKCKEKFEEYDDALLNMAKDAFKAYKEQFANGSAGAFKFPVFVLSDKAECDRFKLFLLKHAGANAGESNGLPLVFMNLQVKTMDAYLFDELRKNLPIGKSDAVKLLNADVLKDLIVHFLSDDENSEFLKGCDKLSEFLHSNTIVTVDNRDKMNLVNLYDVSGTLAALYMDYLNDLVDGKDFSAEKVSDECFVPNNSWQERLRCEIWKKFGIDSILESSGEVDGGLSAGEVSTFADGRYGSYVSLAALFDAVKGRSVKLSQDAYYVDNENAVRPALHSEILDIFKSSESGDGRLHVYSVAKPKPDSAGGIHHSEFQKLIAAPSKIREIEGVHAEICKLLKSGSVENLDDILILAPNISDYRNAIHQVFSVVKGAGNQEDFKYPYVPVDMRGAKTESQVFNILKVLFSVAEKGYYTRKDFFSLLSFDLITRKFGISDDDISNYKEAIEGMSVYRRRPVFDEDGRRKTKGSAEVWKEDWQEGRDRVLLSQLMDKGAAFVAGDESLAAYDTLFGLDGGLAPFSAFVGLLEEWCGIFSGNATFSEFLSGEHEYDCRCLMIKDPNGENEVQDDQEASIADDIDSIASVFRSLLVSDLGGDDDELKDENAVMRSVLRKAYVLKNLYVSERKIPYYVFKETLLDSMDEVVLKDELSVSGGIRADSISLSNPIPCKYLFLVGFGSNVFCIGRQENVLDYRLSLDKNFPDRRHDGKVGVLKAQVDIPEKFWVSFTDKDLKKDEDFYLSSEIADILESYGFELPENPDEKSDKYIRFGINWNEEVDTKELWTSREYRNMSYSKNRAKGVAGK